MLRVVWDARNESPAGAGTLRISLHSGVSGRFLAPVIDHHGAGHDTAYVGEDPREFFLVIESANLDWTVEVAEGYSAARRDQ